MKMELAKSCQQLEVMPNRRHILGGVDMRVLLALLLLLSTPAWGKWMNYANTDTTSFYFDPATVKGNGNFRRVSILMDENQKHETGIASLRVLDEYDCKRRRYRSLSTIAYSGHIAEGKILFSRKKPSEWNFVLSDTPAESMYKILC